MLNNKNALRPILRHKWTNIHHVEVTCTNEHLSESDCLFISEKRIYSLERCAN
jgi:hypothetical protein